MGELWPNQDRTQDRIAGVFNGMPIRVEAGVLSPIPRDDSLTPMHRTKCGRCCAMHRAAAIC